MTEWEGGEERERERSCCNFDEGTDRKMEAETDSGCEDDVQSPSDGLVKITEELQPQRSKEISLFDWGISIYVCPLKIITFQNLTPIEQRSSLLKYVKHFFL